MTRKKSSSQPSAGRLEEALREKVEKYRALTGRALQEVGILSREGTREHGLAEMFLDTARRYYADASYYQEKGDLPTALAAYSYAHAWLDAGVRSRFLEGKNEELFMQP